MAGRKQVRRKIGDGAVCNYPGCTKPAAHKMRACSREHAPLGYYGDLKPPKGWSRKAAA